MQHDRHLTSWFRSVWAVVAACVLLVAVAGSVLAARSEATHRVEDAQRRFASSASDVAARLRLTLDRQSDLSISAAAQLGADPAHVASSFGSWASRVEVLKRYPEVLALGVIVPVDASALKAKGLVVKPPGHRPVYCLPIAGVGRGVLAPSAPGTDYCVGAAGAFLLAARDSGHGSYAPLALGGSERLAVQTPVYRGSEAPATVAARRASIIGWAGMVVDPHAVLTAAAADKGLALSLSHAGLGAPVTFSFGRPASHGQVSVTDLGNGWTAHIVGARLPGDVLDGGQPFADLLAGIAISILLSALVLLLGTGRARALNMVRTRTGELHHLSLHDGLTGLPNRALVLDRVQRVQARARREHTRVAVFFLDLDGFKDVNDMYGHGAGDLLLRAVSARLSGAIRDTDTVGRLGGDEFVVVAEGPSLAAGPEVIAERIQAVLKEPFVLEGPEPITVRTRVSIGIAEGERDSAEELLRDADVALYEAKSAGKDRFVVFVPEMQRAVLDRLELERDLRNAIGSDQLFLLYQPSFDLRSETITGVEALLRWNHPTRGVLMPDDFMPLAEETGLIVPIGRAVLAEACAQASRWQSERAPFRMAVNVSGRQFDGDSDLVADMWDALVASDLDPSLLTVEIAETILMRDATRSAATLWQLKALGVRVAVAGFGTGYCSLAYLEQLPVDALKIDRRFITGVASRPAADALIHALVQLGTTLGIETSAEGIGERGDSAPAALLARPLSPAALEQLLRRWPPKGNAMIPSQSDRVAL